MSLFPLDVSRACIKLIRPSVIASEIQFAKHAEMQFANHGFPS